MQKGTLNYEPTCNLDEAIRVFPFALIVLAKLIPFAYPRLMNNTILNK